MNDRRQGSPQVFADAADAVEARVIAPLRRANLEPDDLQLARLSATLDAALRDAAVPRASARAPRTAGRRARLVGGVGAALAVAAIATLLAAPSLRHRPQPDAAGPARKQLPIARDGDNALPRPRPLVVPAGRREQGRIGERVRFTLVGPGEVSAFAAADGAELDLTSGRLLVDYDGQDGETLRVRSPGAVTTVVGTLFAVEARGSTSRVAVARGVVAVEGAGARLRQILAGQSWLAEAPETEPIPSDLAADLAGQDGAAPAATDRGELANPDPPRVVATGARARRRPEPPHVTGDAEAEYAAAEELMRAGAAPAARKALLDVVAAHPGDPRAELALLDLARLALAAGRPMEARRHVERLLASTKDDALANLARQMERRIESATATAPASNH